MLHVSLKYMFGVRTHALNSSRNISVNWAIHPFRWNCVATTSTGKTTFRISFFWDSPHWQTCYHYRLCPGGGVKYVPVSTASTYLAFNKLSRYVTRQSQSVSARMVAVRRASKGFLHKALDLYRMPAERHANRWSCRYTLHVKWTRAFCLEKSMWFCDVLLTS